MRKTFVFIMFLLVFFNINSQTLKTKIAIAISMDTVFTVYGFDEDLSYDVNLSKDLFDMVCNKLDTTFLKIDKKTIPSNIPLKDGGILYPTKSRYLPWLTELREKEGYDLVVILGKPLIHPQSPYYRYSGYSYGMTTINNVVFSLNIAYILDTRTYKVIGEYGMHQPTEFISRLDKKDRFFKPYNKFTVDDTQKAQLLVVKLNEDFAKNVCLKIEEVNNSIRALKRL